MKKSLLILMSTSLLFAGSCTDWYKKMRTKYHIVGTGTGIVMDDRGNWQKLFAEGTAGVDFDDPDEYEDALAEAEMKAKANIAHFLKEGISDDRTLNLVSKKLKELQKQGNAQSVKVNKKNLKVKMQNISNNASSLLKGVLILCESVDPKAKRAIVVVGVSPKTQRAADSARASMYKDHTTGERISAPSAAPSTPTKIKGYMDATDSLDF